MFTGLVEEIGLIKQIRSIAGGRRITISASRVLDGLTVDNSLCVSGVCLTVIAVKPQSFTVEAVGETLQKTTLGRARPGQPLNLERALQLDQRLGGHLLQGHVNGMGQIRQLQQRGENWYLEIEIPKHLARYVIEEGSIAIDGISLTVAHIREQKIGISVIPYTYTHTTLSKSRSGQYCYVEVDFIGKYVEKLAAPKDTAAKSGRLTIDWLKKIGFE
jgi:riboflavin synthase